MPIAQGHSNVAPNACIICNVDLQMVILLDWHYGMNWEYLIPESYLPNIFSFQIN